jgi:hypothetical protein
MRRLEDIIAGISLMPVFCSMCRSVYQRGTRNEEAERYTSSILKHDSQH